MKLPARILIVTLFILSAALLGDCTRHPPLEEMDVQEAFRYLEQLYHSGKYQRAAEGLNFFTLTYSGDALIDSAQFLLAMTHLKLKEYLLAADAFDELVRRFPSSNLVPEAMYMVGECYWNLSPHYALDQKYTLKAIDALQTFIDYYPDHRDRVESAQELIFKCRSKLAHKEYSNGLIYLKMKDYRAAEIYFSAVLDEYYDTEWAARSSYQLGVCHARNGDVDQAVAAFEDFLAKYPSHPWRGRVEEALMQARAARGEGDGN